jgi:hypothetical protein
MEGIEEVSGVFGLEIVKTESNQRQLRRDQPLIVFREMVLGPNGRFNP